MWLEGVPAWKSASWVPPERRTADYDAEAIDHDDRPIYKRSFQLIFRFLVTGKKYMNLIIYYIQYLLFYALILNGLFVMPYRTRNYMINMSYTN
ncbi:CEQ_1a_G0047050.mRNA.1.CDS.1 [Saccharomyces cerevisiae]|nr:CEQ_1a_G0047050.mRNA.1.CDS.1 [Saccharomyces cerevisiae]CAI7432545.1 CEQ_1a_G0047050.mRNA.1.CDS.1 [Saccharomyces cerevisiae]